MWNGAEQTVDSTMSLERFFNRRTQQTHLFREKKRRLEEAKCEQMELLYRSPREVKEAIQQLKNNKSAGKHGIGAELIKMGPEKLATYLHRLIVRIWENEQVPEEWKKHLQKR